MDRWVYEALKIASVNFTNIQYIPEILVQLLLLSPHSKIPHTHSADFACFFYAFVYSLLVIQLPSPVQRYAFGRWAS